MCTISSSYLTDCYQQSPGKELLLSFLYVTICLLEIQYRDPDNLGKKHRYVLWLSGEKTAYNCQLLTDKEPAQL